MATEQTFVPMVGRVRRAFARVWQVVRYETGYSAEKLGIEAEAYIDDFYNLGRLDAKADAAAAKVTA